MTLSIPRWITELVTARPELSTNKGLLAVEGDSRRHFSV